MQAERRNTAEQRERAERAEEKNIQTAIETYQEMNAFKDDVQQRIQRRFNISEEVAGEKMALYWKRFESIHHGVGAFFWILIQKAFVICYTIIYSISGEGFYIK